MDPSSKASMERAMQLAEAGQLEQARDTFQQVLQDCPNDAAAHEMMAQVLLELDQPEDAIQAAEKAVALNPQWVEAHVTLARAQRNAGLLPESLASYHLAKPTDLRVVWSPESSQMLITEGSADCQEVASELEEVSHLHSQQVAQQVGLPLNISTAPGSGLGPGCVVWDSGLLLARYLAKHTPAGVLQNQVMLELGAGTGLVGLAAAALGAQVMLTDEPDVMPLLKQNIQQNLKVVQAAGGSAQSAPLSWHHLHTDRPTARPKEPTVPVYQQLHTQLPQSGTPTLCQGKETYPQAQETVAQFLKQGVQLHGRCWLLGSDLVHAEKQVPQLLQALSWVLQQVTAATTASKQSADRLQQGSGGTTCTPLIRFMLAHKHRSQGLDLQLLHMLQQFGFVFVEDEMSTWGMKQSCTSSASGHGHTCDHHDHDHGLLSSQQQQQAGEWADHRLAEYENCGLYCLVFGPDGTAQRS